MTWGTAKSSIMGGTDTSQRLDASLSPLALPTRTYRYPYAPPIPLVSLGPAPTVYSAANLRTTATRLLLPARSAPCSPARTAAAASGPLDTRHMRRTVMASALPPSLQAVGGEAFLRYWS